jgi:hypothetical protein
MRNVNRLSLQFSLPVLVAAESDPVWKQSAHKRHRNMARI